MNYKQLTETERYQIYSLKKAEHTQQEIAKLIGRSASTIKPGVATKLRQAQLQGKTSASVVY
ncbi:MAG: helix-turn-helix domain-containing protein [Nitrosomonas sp.]|nr:helix-turn-helix domain-containing protein [Nitrosomonas sp.]